MTAQDDLALTFEDFFRRCMGVTEDNEVDRLLDLELSMSQVKSIFVLNQSAEPITITALAERLRLSIATAGRTVDQLVRDGLASRTEDPADRRVKLVEITSAGREIAEQHYESHRRNLRVVCARLGDDEAKSLTAAFQPLIAAVDHPQHQETPA